MKKIVLIIVGVIITIFSLIFLTYKGYFWPNNIFALHYDIQGLDVSNHQGNIKWESLLNSNGYKFVFIKATEGNDYKDKYFLTNWEGATKVNLYKGAYHYFTLKSSGKEQAMNFIDYVPAEKGCLPPVVDIEENGLDKLSFQKELRDFLLLLEDRYKQKPILYTVYSLYDEYIKGDFNQYPIWIRDIIMPPRLSDRREWLFWQYNSRGKTDGINTYVDFNVFNGSMEKLEAMLSKY